MSKISSKITLKQQQQKCIVLMSMSKQNSVKHGQLLQGYHKKRQK